MNKILILLLSLLISLSTNAQIAHQIEYCDDTYENVIYHFNNDPSLIYTFSVTNGVIESMNADNIEVRWNLSYGYGGLYIDVANMYGCHNEQYMYMEVVPCTETTIYVPNSFTPTENNVNDTFTAKGTNLSNYEMVIYDRWGEIIYITGNIHNGWDGRLNGKKCQQGIYVYQIQYDDNQNAKHSVVGIFSLIYY